MSRRTPAASARKSTPLAEQAAEQAAADEAVKAEAVVPPGGNVADVRAAANALAPALLHVRALPDFGFRRAGRFWPADDGVTVFADHFSPAQIAVLFAEPQLVVTPIAREAL